jgi:DNA-binding response OmpR family regulator
MQESQRTAHVMVVDDDPDTVVILSRHVQREGYTVIKASSGRECLRLLREHTVDIILLDLMMPEVDGFDVCRALKANPATADIPIIMITARDDLEGRAEGMRLGVADFLAKPVFRRQLANRISAQLDAVAAGRTAEAALNRLRERTGNRQN